MKTYYAFFMLFAVALIGCSKSDGPTNGDVGIVGFDVGYSLLLSKQGALASSLLNANLETITVNSNDGPFENIPTPQHTYRDGSEMSFYTKNLNCSGEFTRFDFDTDTSVSFPVFTDIGNCGLSVIGIAHSQNFFFLAYELPQDGKEDQFFIRIVDATDPEENSNFIDILLDKRPLQLVSSKNRLFILVVDEAVTGKYSIIVFDTGTKGLVHEKNLGIDVQKIVKDHNGDIMVNYPQLHSVISSNTLAIISETRYLDGKETKFGNSPVGYFNGNRLYYPMETDIATIYPHIPAVYDFGTKTAILYLYENFLTLEERQFEFGIGDTTMVFYDAKNNLILIGYRKKADPNLGGLLRIKPAPDSKFIDNTDLDGVPQAVFFR